MGHDERSELATRPMWRERLASWASEKKHRIATFPMTVRCALCGWSAEGPGSVVIVAQGRHASDAHGITAEVRSALQRARG